MEQLYNDAIDILDVLLTEEDDFHTASRLNAIMVELAALKRAAEKSKH